MVTSKFCFSHVEVVSAHLVYTSIYIRPFNPVTGTQDGFIRCVLILMIFSALLAAASQVL